MAFTYWTISKAALERHLHAATPLLPTVDDLKNRLKPLFVRSNYSYVLVIELGSFCDQFVVIPLLWPMLATATALKRLRETIAILQTKRLVTENQPLQLTHLEQAEVGTELFVFSGQAALTWFSTLTGCTNLHKWYDWDSWVFYSLTALVTGSSYEAVQSARDKAKGGGELLIEGSEETAVTTHRKRDIYIATLGGGAVGHALVETLEEMVLGEAAWEMWPSIVRYLAMLTAAVVSGYAEAHLEDKPKAYQRVGSAISGSAFTTLCLRMAWGLFALFEEEDYKNSHHDSEHENVLLSRQTQFWVRVATLLLLQASIVSVYLGAKPTLVEQSGEEKSCEASSPSVSTV